MHCFDEESEVLVSSELNVGDAVEVQFSIRIYDFLNSKKQQQQGFSFDLKSIQRLLKKSETTDNSFKSGYEVEKMEEIYIPSPKKRRF